MIAAEQGSIINIDSLNSHTPLERVSVYAMAKAAMRQMTKYLAIEWGPRVRVNGIGPGLTITDLTRPLLETENTPVSQWRRKNTPLRRVAVPRRHGRSGDLSRLRRRVVHHRPNALCRRRRNSGLFWPLDGRSAISSQRSAISRGGVGRLRMRSAERIVGTRTTQRGNVGTTETRAAAHHFASGAAGAPSVF